ncbi:MAG: ABC transporter ATP-binding protein [Bacillota bacterium]|nr:ABC transporter ATP-binding protein [Bacillota bacterium]MDD3297889.1 ABC transporter ATP-binding protein [Bacillota bacterium]MDD4707692.1 ABC transporter ATP-binding protein [Bacillota bacterium]
MSVKLSIKDASFGYNDSQSVWENINIDVREGECLCLLGPNGCGKTTLLNCINGTYALKEGSVFVNNKNIKEMSIIQLAQTIGIVFQEHSAPFPYSSLEVVRMGRTPHLGLFETPSEEDTRLALSIMEELGIAHLAGKSYTHISGGERQLVLIARTLCQQPEIILFDEPTSHLDFKNQAMVLRTIKNLSQKGMTIVMTSHFPNHVWDIGTRVSMLGFGGMVVQGPVEEVMTEKNLSKTYGVETKIYDAKSGIGHIRFCAPNLG